MENASKALLMAASVLIGVLLMSLMVYVFFFASDYSSKIDDNLYAKEVYETNVKFEIYNGRNDLTIHDVQTIFNLVENYNKETQLNKITIKGNVTEVSLKDEINKDLDVYKNTTYTCSMNYKDKKINDIKITKNL